MKWFSAALMMSSLMFAACGSQPSVGSKTLATDDQEIIGGFDSSGKSLEMVGTVGIDYEGEYYMLCTATLIGPRTVLTAKHCTVFLDDGWTPPQYVGQPMIGVYDMSFNTGNALAPTKKYKAIWAEVSGINEGGLVGLGNDVGVYYLAEDASDLQPLEYATSPLGEDLLGQKATMVGYGSQNNDQDASGQLNGTRKTGSTTLAAYQGKFYELALGSYDNFLAFLVESYDQEQVDECLADPDCKAMIEGWYNDTVLLDGYELWVKKEASDAVTCHGDSGGPLLKKITTADGSLKKQILAVVSGGMGSKELACDYGTVYAMFGLDTQSFLAKSLTWVDPCAGESLVGQCIGTVAQRCSGLFEGPRRLLVNDCADLDQVCAPSADTGLIGCTDAEAPTPSERVAAKSSKLASMPTPEALRVTIDAAAAGYFNKAKRPLLDRLENKTN